MGGNHGFTPQRATQVKRRVRVTHGKIGETATGSVSGLVWLSWQSMKLATAAWVEPAQLRRRENWKRLDRSALGRIERHDRYVLDYELVALAKSLRVKPEELLPREHR